MPSALSVMLPIALIIALGVVAARSGAASDKHIEGMARFVLDFALPAVVFLVIARQDLRLSFDAGYVAAYAGGSLVAFLATFLGMRLLMGRARAAAAMAALGASASNSGFIGYPVALTAMGAPALAAFPMTMLVENVLIIPLALLLAELGSGDGARSAAPLLLRRTALRLARTPLILAIVAGVLVSLAGFEPPSGLMAALGMLSAASVPCALFVVGGTIAGTRGRDVSSDMFLIVAGKLVLHPIAVAVLLLAADVPSELTAVGILFASVPMITIYPLLCGRFGLAKTGAAALVAATALGLVTMGAVLGLVLPLFAGPS